MWKPGGREAAIATESQNGSEWNPAAALACWLLPGLGYLLVGQARRGVIVGVTIMSLWTAGLLVGGVSSVSLPSPQPPDQFLAVLQPLIAPSLVVGAIHRRFRLQDSGAVSESPYRPSFGRVAEIGMYYTAIAGMLNLLCIIDLVYRQPHAATTPRPAAGGGA